MVTAERLEPALAALAWLVETYGQQYTPLYESIEQWLSEVRARESTRDRIKRTLLQSALHSAIQTSQIQ